MSLPSGVSPCIKMLNCWHRFNDPHDNRGVVVWSLGYLLIFICSFGFFWNAYELCIATVMNTTMVVYCFSGTLSSTATRPNQPGSVQLQPIYVLDNRVLHCPKSHTNKQHTNKSSHLIPGTSHVLRFEGSSWGENTNISKQSEVIFSASQQNWGPPSPSVPPPRPTSVSVHPCLRSTRNSLSPALLAAALMGKTEVEGCLLRQNKGQFIKRVTEMSHQHLSQVKQSGVLCLKIATMLQWQRARQRGVWPNLGFITRKPQIIKDIKHG